MGFLPVNWGSDLAIYTDQVVPPRERSKSSREGSSNERQKERDEKNSKDGESSDEKKAKVDKKRKEEKQYLYNVPYIFSRVEKPKMHKLVI